MCIVCCFRGIFPFQEFVFNTAKFLSTATNSSSGGVPELLSGEEENARFRHEKRNHSKKNFTSL